MIDTINQVFSLFRVNYHNQFHAAFGDTVLLNQAKRLWKEALQPFDHGHILSAARLVIEESEYLPTLQRMLSACEAGLQKYGLPPARRAYLEAANAASPKNAQNWSHPVVYLAGCEVGWYNLSHQPEGQTWPAFLRAYRALVKRALNGERFEVDAPDQLEHTRGQPADPATVRKELEELKALLDD